MKKHTLFITKFVNGVYGILLGFGFSNFINDIILKGEDLTWLISHIAMSVFIIFVVCLYWWDWSKYIESKAKSTFKEFIIDILILFSLQSLFFLFENPLALITIFLIISILNFIWVVNFLWEKYKDSSQSKDYFKKNNHLKYILKKIYSIIIYTFCLLIIYQIHLFYKPNYSNLELKENHLTYIISGGLIIISFLFDRYISFKNRPGIDLT